MLKVLKNPAKSQFHKMCERPKIDITSLNMTIQSIFDDVKSYGDSAIIKYSEKYDSVLINELIIEVGKPEEMVEIAQDLRTSMDMAYQNIYNFHLAQQKNDIQLETTSGVLCTQKSVPIQRVGLYIPGGSAPLFSTVLMLAIPAKIAGCKEVIMCTPPNKTGKIHPAIQYAAALCGISRIVLAGGAQAIAGMTFGTKSIPAVNKIFGPGNQYVTAAKQAAQQYGVAIDMPAGPSEVLVYADETCIPTFVAADLLSQAEHGEDSQVILVADSLEIIKDVNTALQVQLQKLPRQQIATQALSQSKAVFIPNKKKAFEFINYYSPEHLIIASDHFEDYVDMIQNAGSVFLGNYCPESAGDYATGTNHTLPTNGWSRSYSGVNLDSFIKKITFQTISKKGIQNLGHHIIRMAETENLHGHAYSIQVRLDTL